MADIYFLFRDRQAAESEGVRLWLGAGRSTRCRWETGSEKCKVYDRPENPQIEQDFVEKPIWPQMFGGDEGQEGMKRGRPCTSWLAIRLYMPTNPRTKPPSQPPEPNTSNGWQWTK